jgi:hypothetical protein
MERKKFLGILAAIFLGLLFAGESVNAQLTINATDTATVTVTLAMRTIVDISPSIMTWTVDPGAVCGRDISGSTCNETTGNFRAVQIENIGSRNITRIWFNTTMPTQSPFATGDTSQTDSGNYVVMTQNESVATPFYFVKRVEYNSTRDIWYLTDPDGNMPPNVSKFTYGRFHNGSEEYFWFIDKPSTGLCNESSYIRIGNTAHTQSATGSVDFSDASQYDEITLTPGTTYATGDINTGPLDGYSVAVSNTTAAGCRVMFSHWFKDYPFDTLSEAVYSFDSTTNPLVPGDSIAKLIGVIVPYGIHEGASGQGTLTVLVTAA